MLCVWEMLLTCLLLALAPAYLGMHILWIYDLCVRNALTCLMLTLAPAYLGMNIDTWYVCDKCVWHAFCSLWLQLTLVCTHTHIYIYAMCVWKDCLWHAFCSLFAPAYLGIYTYSMPIEMPLTCLLLTCACSLPWTWHVVCSLVFVWVFGSASSLLGVSMTRACQT